MEVTPGKIASLVIAVGYASIPILAGGVTLEAFLDTLRFGVVLLLPLALIWFPDELGSYAGYVGKGGFINVESAPVLVSFMGWFFLVGLPLLGYLLGIP